jgi:hypothetical protein
MPTPNLNPPEPTYERDIPALVQAYKNAIQRVMNELERLNISDLSRANSAAALADIAAILRELDAETATWVSANVPLAAQQGVERAIINLGDAKSLAEAKDIAEFNRVNRNMVAAAVADTQDDLLQITQNVERKVRTAVRQAVGESMRANMAAGINGRRTITRGVVSGIRGKLGRAANTGIIDAAGRRWKPEVYAETVVRTKTTDIYNEATSNEAVSHGAMYGIISFVGSTDACRFHEGRIIKLTADAPGSYPTYSQLRASGQIFHPRCRHHYSVFRQETDLPQPIRDEAEKQSELGQKALATNKRNPKEVDA